jgi:hypothetical protein
MRTFTLTLTAVALVLGAVSLANAQTLRPGAGSLLALKNATPIVTLAACNGHTGACGCGRGFVSACVNRCCRCVPC